MSDSHSNSAPHHPNGPLVTVIIPAFNASKYIAQTLQSACSQTHKYLDILVVDDGSTDNTAVIVERVRSGDERVRLISKPNGGLSSARNHGLAHAHGEYVAFLDADDLWHPAKLEKQLAVIEAPTEVLIGAVYTLYRAIDSADRLIEDHYFWNISGSVLAQHLVYNFIGAGGSSLLCRRDVALSVGGFDITYQGKNGGFCEDYDFQLKIASTFGIDLVPEYLVGYRKHASSMSTDRLRHYHSQKAVIEHHLDQHPELSNQCRRMARGTIYAMHVRMLFNARRYAQACKLAFRLLVADPLRFAVECTWRAPAGVFNSLVVRISSRWKLRGRETPHFGDLNPTVARPRPLPPFTSLRLGILGKDDARRFDMLHASSTPGGGRD